MDQSEKFKLELAKSKLECPRQPTGEKMRRARFDFEKLNGVRIVFKESGIKAKENAADGEGQVPHLRRVPFGVDWAGRKE